jgi:hypothetical protein
MDKKVINSNHPVSGYRWHKCVNIFIDMIESGNPAALRTHQSDDRTEKESVNRAICFFCLFFTCNQSGFDPLKAFFSVGCTE